MEYYRVDPEKPQQKIIDRAVHVIRNGGIVVYPTDTLYGLGVDIYNQQALNKLYHIKGRNSVLPVSLLVNNFEQIENFAGTFPFDVYGHLKKLLPGRITVLFENKHRYAISFFKRYETLGKPLHKVGFRIPDHAVCKKLTDQLGWPITSTSANLSGKDNVTSIQEVIAQFGNKLDCILDAGPMESKRGSTVIDMSKRPYLVLREGDISMDELRHKAPSAPFKKRKFRFVVTFVCSGNICRSPMAEILLKAKIEKTKYRDFMHIQSAGTLGIEDQPADDMTIVVCTENELDVSRHRSQGISTNLMEDSDLVIAMAANHVDFLKEHYPEHRDKIVLLKNWQRTKALANPSIADPVGQNKAFFRDTFNEIRNEIKRILPGLFTRVRAFMEYNDLME